MGEVLVEFSEDMYLLSGSGFYWTLTLAQTGSMVTKDSSGSFTYTNDVGSPLFKIQKIAVDRGILYMNYFDPTELPVASIIPDVANSTAYAFRKEGDNVVMVFWDEFTNTWVPVASRIMDTLHFGDPEVDGTWRLKLVGTNLEMQRREATIWVTKDTVSS